MIGLLSRASDALRLVRPRLRPARSIRYQIGRGMLWFTAPVEAERFQSRAAIETRYFQALEEGFLALDKVRSRASLDDLHPPSKDVQP